MNADHLKRPVVVVGLGELGGVFARGFLKCGHPVFPVTREVVAAEVVRHVPSPELVLMAVGESQLAELKPTLPASWQGRLALVQNELLPAQYERWPDKPTVAVVWFEKKPGIEAKVVLPTVVGGPQAELLHRALTALSIDATVAATEAELLAAMVEKNVYILTTNIAGLVTDVSASELWEQHHSLVERVAQEVIAIQAALSGAPLDPPELLAKLKTAIFADPSHRCRGRSAPARLSRARQHAESLGLRTPELDAIASRR